MDPSFEVVEMPDLDHDFRVLGPGFDLELLLELLLLPGKGSLVASRPSWTRLQTPPLLELLVVNREFCLPVLIWH